MAAKAYIIVTRTTAPVCKRNGVDLTPIKTDRNGSYYISVYEADNIVANETWVFQGTGQFNYLK